MPRQRRSRFDQTQLKIHGSNQPRIPLKGLPSGTKSQIQLKPRFNSYHRASLEGLPVEIKLQILTLIGDIPSLRRLRLASQEYYAVVRAYTSYLKPVYKDEIKSRTCIVKRGRVISDDRANVEEHEHALTLALLEWDRITPDAAKHNPAYVYTVPGNLGFQYNRDNYAAFRMYVATGEHFNLIDIASHIQRIKRHVHDRFDAATLRSGDLQLMQALGEVSNAPHELDLEAKLHAIQSAKVIAKDQAWPAEIQNMSCEYVYNQIELSRAVAVVTAACQLRPRVAFDIYRAGGAYGPSFAELLETLHASGLPLVLHRKRREFVDLTVADPNAEDGAGRETRFVSLIDDES